MAKKYKCPYCEERLIRKDLINHIDKKHEVLIPQGYTSSRLVYNQVNKVDQGKCRVCGNITTWNEKSGRYNVLCNNPKCKEHMREEYKKNMLKVRGTYNILSDPEQQRKMLANRSISGIYKFTDGGSLIYTGSYEKKCLEFMDVVMQIPSKDILSPGPTLEYMYNGVKHFYITDFYYIPYNLIIEVKDGGDNLNTKESPSMKASREKTIEKERIITDRGEYNYIRLTNNNFAQLIEIFMDIKQKLLEGDDSKTYKINESSMILESYFNESKEDIAAILLGKRKLINDKYTAIYHGTNIGNLKTIIPNSYNAGMRGDKVKRSSFWFNNAKYAIMFATMTVLTNFKDLIPYALIDNDMKLLIQDKYKNNALSILRTNSGYIYEKFIETKYLGYGHNGLFPEYTLDIPVMPDHCYEIEYNKMIDTIKFVSDTYFNQINSNYDNGKMTFEANKFQKIINIIFYYRIDHALRDAKRQNKLFPMVIESKSLVSMNEIKQLSDKMKKEIKYSSPSNWVLKSPEEVGETKCGNCHDQASYIEALLKKLHIKCGKLFMIEYSGEEIFNAGTTHTLVWFVYDNKYYWFENAWSDLQGIHGPFNDLVNLKNFVYSKWKFSSNCNKLYICSISTVNPGINLNDYVCVALNNNFKPKDYYLKK